jgi:ferredoxin
MGTGPAARAGFDLAMTELRAGFVVRGGSARGAALVARLPTREPSAAELELAELKVRRAREHMGRALDARRAAGLLRGTTEHPRFDAVAKRCLSCGNCTLVCPTCFCSTVTDTTSLTDGSATRTRRWESCFTHQFSYTTPGPVRTTIRGRYRHWLRHKLCTWWEQFGTSGCVGCGRCITWCPVGIDLTEELAAIAANDNAAAPTGGPQ